jgi:hypothetical protein
MWPVRAKAPRRAGLSLRSRIAARLGERDRYLDASPMMRDCDVASLGSPPAVVFRRTGGMKSVKWNARPWSSGSRSAGPDLMLVSIYLCSGRLDQQA